ncbi:MAG: hypothetical protein ACLFVU_03785 [Phycisphaerae bacterium]
MSDQPNILFLLSDEHSFRFMGHCPESEGGEPAETLTLDLLAETGTVFTTIPQTLSEAGYETALIGKMHRGGSRQFAGFQHRPYRDLTGRTGHKWEPIDHQRRHGTRSRTADAGVPG